ncbi:SWI/SNF and RSC complex subunit Ssr2 [Tieghemiomyces parasiticus]|uniref:SWI/SNF and RSC complex subunit Ssr2 n=1 Tax=Tieghemiomyces parasiticus TaxID=78921 RepID=A0A9W7ZTP9_9FUNG|nr:SWI/SNF and RSC complex subunit Ssr2 [Tieghemiomyces parasiticus]
MRSPLPALLDADFLHREPVKRMLEAVRQQLVGELPWLGSEVQPLTPESLGQLLRELWVAQDRALGRQAAAEYHARTPASEAWTPKLPVGVFLGPLLTAAKNVTAQSPPAPLAALLRLTLERIRHLDPQTPLDRLPASSPTTDRSFFDYLARDLAALQHLSFPRVAFATEVDPATRDALTPLVQQLRGSIVGPEDNPTHTVRLPRTGTEVVDPAHPQYFRPVARVGDRVLVHWISLPDTYDDWKPASSAYAVGDIPEHSHAIPSILTGDWITDSHRYNEWMNAEDYVPESAVDLPSTASAIAATGIKRKFPVPDDANAPPTTTDKRPKTEPEDVTMTTTARDDPRVTMIDPEDPETRAAAPGKRSEFEPHPAGDLANISHSVPDPTTLDAQAETLATVAENADLPDDEMSTLQALGETSNAPLAAASSPSTGRAAVPTVTEPAPQAVQARAQLYLARQTYEVVVPSYAAWFTMDSLHANEKRGLPEFFNGRNRSKTPSVYKDYRDFMINTYRLHPTEYLTVTACRRNLVGDVCAIMRVHAFLEQWGLINYQVDPDSRPSAVGPPFTGHFRVTADTPRGLQPFQPHAPITSTAGGQRRSSATALAAAGGESTAGKSAAAPGLNLALRKHLYDAGAEDSGSTPNVAGSTPRFHCFTCGVDCTAVRYHGLKVKKMDLCAPCYLEGRFPAAMSSGDFVKLEASAVKQAQNDPWTDQETLLLLEGIEMYDNDWFRIADHVGTRTREQCITRFLQLPIEDPYLETATGGDGAGVTGSLFQHQNLPFSQASNPVMSVVAFLAANVNPGVAAAAAQSALKELAASAKAADKDKISKEKEDGVASSAMEVDGKPSEDGTATTSSHEKEAATTNGQDGPPTPAVQRAAAAALGAAAAKAETLARYEERQIQNHVHQAVELQLKKLELKMREFEELETIVRNQQQELEAERIKLLQDRLLVRKTLDELQNAESTPATATSGAATTTMTTAPAVVTAPAPAVPAVAPMAATEAVKEIAPPPADNATPPAATTFDVSPADEDITMATETPTTDN